MSVPKWRRSESRLDAFYEAVKLRHIVTQIVMRSYKLKTNFKSLIPDRLRNEYPELAKFFEKIDRYQETTEETKVLGKYDEWIISKTRSNLFKYSSNLVAHISAANEIKCEIDEEFKQRILLEDAAIGDIVNIKQEVQFVEEFFDIDLNKFMNYDEQLEKTKHYLYRWKKSTVKAHKKFLEEKERKNGGQQAVE